MFRVTRLLSSPIWLGTRDEEIENRTQAERRHTVPCLSSYEGHSWHELFNDFYPCGPNELYSLALMISEAYFPPVFR